MGLRPRVNTPTGEFLVIGALDQRLNRDPHCPNLNLAGNSLVQKSLSHAGLSVPTSQQEGRVDASEA